MDFQFHIAKTKNEVNWEVETIIAALLYISLNPLCEHKICVPKLTKTAIRLWGRGAAAFL